MNVASLLLVLNSIISILHPVKHIPQIIHTYYSKRVEDLSKLNIICELGLNILSLISCILVYIYMGKRVFFLPIVIEKASSLLFVLIILFFKISYTKPSYTYEEIRPLNNNENISINV